VLSGRGLCDGPISRPEESFRVWCVSECDQVKIKQPRHVLCVSRRGQDYEARRINRSDHLEDIVIDGSLIAE
jgi:hypothetical protein